MRWLPPLFAAAWLAACAPVTEVADPSDPLLYDPAALARADQVVVGIPGVMTSVKVLQPMQAFERGDRAVVYFRLPGFDGRPAQESIVIDRAAQRIADLAAVHEVQRVDLVGHSTGAVIALEAAKAIRTQHPDVTVTVTGVATALPAPQPVLAGVRGAFGTVGAALRTGSLDRRTVWLEYYRRLAYGRDVEANPVSASAADALVAANDTRISLPEDGLYRRHTRDLRRWTNPAPETLAGAQITYYHGGADLVFPPRVTQRFVDQLPQAEIAFIEGHGHLLLQTYPEVWDQIAVALDRPVSE